MSTVRDRRLQSDHQRLAALVSRYPNKLKVEAARGNPPESYLLLIKGRGIAAVNRDLPTYCTEQRLRVELPAEYPAVPPLVTVLGPIFHPHVWPRSNVVCTGSWNITEPLDQLVLRLSSLIFYDPEQLNWRSVANQAAADWASRNRNLFPLDLLVETGRERAHNWCESA